MKEGKANRVNKQIGMWALAGLISLAPGIASAAESNLSVGVWATYELIKDNETDEETHGAIKDEALIIYADGAAEPGEGSWLYSAELRIGPGSFTDPANNSTGDEFTLHKAWVGFKLDEKTTLRVGKSQVPFGWKTVNFWPGDILLAGFGDQMDVGLKLSGDRDNYDFDLAYYHADDWGEDSTDTVDDNGHWGSSTTYRKVQTLVGNALWDVADGQQLGLSVQAGRLQDLTGLSTDNEVDGRHQAWVAYYQATRGPFTAKASYIDMSRDLPDNHVINAGLAETIENQRLVAEFGYRRDNWFFYIDASMAKADTSGSDVDDIYSIAPGFSYDYGPGWIYVELLSQDGFVDRNGQVQEGDFDALYISLDFYL